MSRPYTIMRITDVKDSAPGFGLEETQEARFATQALDAERTGVSHLRLKPGLASPSGTATTAPRRCISSSPAPAACASTTMSSRSTPVTRFAWRRRSRAHSSRDPRDSS